MRDYGDPSRLVIEGCKTFTPGEVTAALWLHPDFWIASHPAAPLKAYLMALTTKLTSSYFQAGFGDARVLARVDRKHESIRVEVREGIQYLAGAIEIAGGESIDGNAVVTRLTTSQPLEGEGPPWYLDGIDRCMSPPVWVAGKPGRLDEISLGRMRELVVKELEDQGRYWTKFRLRTSADVSAKVVTAHVLVDRVGPPARVAKITVVGVKKNTPSNLLRWLGLQEGQPFSNQRRRRVMSQLWHCGRFASFSVQVKPGAGSEGDVDLRILVTESRFAPSLNAALSREEQAALDARASIHCAERFDKDLEIESKGAGRKFTAILSPHQGMMFTFGPGNAHQDLAIERAFISGKDCLGYYSRTARQCWVIDRPLEGMKATVDLVASAAQEATENPVALTFSFGIGPDVETPPGGLPFQVRVMPAALFGLVNRAGVQKHWDGEILTIQGGDSRVVIDAGAKAFREICFGKESAGPITRLAIVSGQFSRYRNELCGQPGHMVNNYRARQPISSLADCLLKEGLFAQVASGADAAIYSRIARHLVQKGVLQPLDTFVTNRGGGKGASDDRAILLPVLRIEQKASNDWSKYGPTWAEGLFPRHSWPWVLVRELSWASESLRGEEGIRELERLGSSPHSGPLVGLVLAHVWRATRPSEARRVAMIARDRLNSEDFRKDYRPLLDSRSPFAPWLVNTTAALATLPPGDLRFLAQKLSPRGATTILGAFMPLHSDPTSSAAVGEVLDSVWEAALREVFASIFDGICSRPLSHAERKELARVAYVRGCDHLSWDDECGAIAWFEELIRGAPEVAWGYGGRGCAFREQGDLDSAIRDFDEAVRLDSGDHHLLACRADTYRLRGDLRAAIADYTSALKLAPNEAELYQYRAAVYNLMGDSSSEHRDLAEAEQRRAASAKGIASGYR